MSSIIEKVETFIQRLHDLDYVIDQTATNIWYGRPPPYPTLIDNRTNLADNLSNAITDYEANKGNEQLKLASASRCLMWINKAFACGVIKEGEGLARKLKECQEKNVRLEKDVEKLSIDYLNLKKMQDELEFTRYVGPLDKDDSGDENVPSQ
jgi:hypothetical protein